MSGKVLLEWGIGAAVPRGRLRGGADAPRVSADRVRGVCPGRQISPYRLHGLCRECRGWRRPDALRDEAATPAGISREGTERCSSDCAQGHGKALTVIERRPDRLT
ncbi:hypothetical protein GCM10009730_45870 [Streptomyces albidochromogenes]